jgi:hypothetical protein
MKVSTQTTNYHLIKPADNETADIAVINSNMDTIDTALASASKITDSVTNTKYAWGIENGQLYLKEVE